MRQNKLFLPLTAVVAAAGCAAWWWLNSTPLAAPMPTKMSPTALASTAAPAPAATAEPAAPPQSPAVPTPAVAAAPRPAPSAAAAPPAARREIDALGLDRELTGTHKVSYDGRERSVLGTKQITNQNGTQAVLLVRDDRSGQIDYWQSGLRFELRPGTDYEAFIQGRSALTRRFVNIEHAQVTVDAADIAREHAALQADPRVASVSLLPLVMPVRAR